jgi:hypothetical protein
LLSLVVDPALRYPEPTDAYSPDDRFPEYRFSLVSSKPNSIYRAVRECLVQSGLDRERFGSADWNPLGEWIRPGSQVLVLCNFVLHRWAGESVDNFAAKCINGSVLRALVDYILIAVGNTGRVYFGNSPMQHCRWESVLRETGAKAVWDFYRSNDAPVQARDLRLWVAERSRLGGIHKIERRDPFGGVQVDLGADSLMVSLDGGGQTPYRIMNYDTRRTESYHSSGSHKYVINRLVLESDVVFSLPKLKTHEKVGITCAIKGFVGAVAHKDSLPHYRFGCPSISGDEYPSDEIGMRRALSALHYVVQRATPGTPAGNLLRIMDRSVRRVMGRWMPITEGAWAGNDTAWRMVVDLARILMYAKPSGELADSPQRRHMVLVDGVVGGSGQGPLNPTPIHSCMLLLADNPLVADYACALKMGFDPHSIPMIMGAMNLAKYRLLDRGLAEQVVISNGEGVPISDLTELPCGPFTPTTGWQGKLERRSPGASR